MGLGYVLYDAYINLFDLFTLEIVVMITAVMTGMN